MTATKTTSKFRSRLVLLLIVAMFFGSFGIAAWLRFTGWLPGHSRNLGQLLQPPILLSDLSLQRRDGGAFTWTPDRNDWHLVVTPAADCTTACAALFDRLYRLWLSEGRQASRLQVLWFGDLPPGASGYRGLVLMQASPDLLARLPERAQATAIPADLVDAEGYVILHYRAGFDAADVRKDLSRLLK